MTSLRVVVFLLIIWTYAVGAAAATLLVPSEYLTIQSAVNAAIAGDEIVVSAGVFEEQLVIKKNITLTGAGIGQTVLLAPTEMPHTAYVLNYNAVRPPWSPCGILPSRVPAGGERTPVLSVSCTTAPAVRPSGFISITSTMIW